MSDIDISKLSSHHLPVKDSSGALADSPIEMTSSSFLAIDDDGYMGGSQIQELRLNGLNVENSNNGMLYINILDEDGTILQIRKSEYGNPSPTEDDLLVQCNLSSYTLNETLFFTGSDFHPEISGTIKLSSVATDTYIALFVPLSSITPQIFDEGFYIFSDMKLHGVSIDNSMNGILVWAMILGDGTFRFELRAAEGRVVASTEGSIYDYPPLTCELMEEDYSGISGTVVFEGFQEADGRLVIKVPDGIRIPVMAGSGSRILKVDDQGLITPVAL